MLITVVVILLVLGLLGWSPIYGRYSYYGGLSWVGLLLVVLLLLWLAGLLR